MDSLKKYVLEDYLANSSNPLTIFQSRNPVEHPQNSILYRIDHSRLHSCLTLKLLPVFPISHLGEILPSVTIPLQGHLDDKLPEENMIPKSIREESRALLSA